MNWDDLRYLLATSRTNTLTKAANALGVNQTTVSRRLQSLEQQLGVRLVERSEKGLALTDSGQELVEAAYNIENIVAEASRKVTNRDTKLRGELRITTIDMIAIYEAELFREFSDKYTEVNLVLHMGYELQNLNKREADIAIRWTSSPPPYLIAHKLSTISYALYGAESLLKNYPDKEVDITTLPWLGWTEERGARVTQEWMKNNAPNAHTVCQFDNAIAMIASVKAGLGISFIPCIYGDPDPNLRKLRPNENGFDIDVWLLTHPDLRNNARIRAFSAHAREYFGRR